MDLLKVKNSYLNHIKIFIDSKNNDKHLLRCFIDNWFAYHKKGPFLSKNNKPVWFNKPNPVKSKDALLSMHFISKKAFEVIKNQNLDVRLIKEHSIPVSIIYDLLLEQDFNNENDIEIFLLKYYRLGVLTKDEDNVLAKEGLKKKMPENWNMQMNVFYRYEKVGIISK
jgi:hypothetical protein